MKKGDLFITVHSRTIGRAIKDHADTDSVIYYQRHSDGLIGERSIHRYKTVPMEHTVMTFGGPWWNTE